MIARKPERKVNVHMPLKKNFFLTLKKNNVRKVRKKIISPEP